MKADVARRLLWTSRNLRLDPFMGALIATILLATLLPASGAAVGYLTLAVKGSVILLFFLYGARLSRDAVIEGLLHWRLHLLVLGATFVLFPLLGLLLLPLGQMLFALSGLYTGVLFLCCLPSTVQSSIAFTSIARGNISAAICAASASNLIGIVLTPALAALLLARHGGFSAAAVGDIAMTLLLPFLAGQICRGMIGSWTARHKTGLAYIDRGVVLLMVYSAFSKAVIDGIWGRVSLLDLLALILFCCALLAMAMVIITFSARRFGFDRADHIAILFCGSKKSLITGVPMANILFTGPMIGVVILPVMLYHQIQLVACAIIARHYARQDERLPADATTSRTS